MARGQHLLAVLIAAGVIVFVAVSGCGATEPTPAELVASPTHTPRLSHTYTPVPTDTLTSTLAPSATPILLILLCPKFLSRVVSLIIVANATTDISTDGTTTLPPPTSTPAAVCDCSGNVFNCAGFGTRAQACYEYCKGQGRGDVHRLDRDKDGVVCEALP